MITLDWATAMPGRKLKSPHRAGFVKALQSY
jgi:hypothetical protein